MMELTPEKEQQLIEAFAYFDVSGDGQIDGSELATILEAVLHKKPSDEDIKNMLKEADQNDGGDGKIDLPEFLELMRK